MTFTIPAHELEFRASRAGGPGGQHVNTSSTRVEVRWNVRSSPSLTDAQRERLLKKLATRVDSRGYIRAVSGARRSQLHIGKAQWGPAREYSDAVGRTRGDAECVRVPPDCREFSQPDRRATACRPRITRVR